MLSTVSFPWCSSVSVRRLAAAFLVLLLCGGTGAAADPQVLPELALGFAGKFKLGRWTPLEIRLRGGDERTIGTLRVRTPDSDGAPTEVVLPQPIQLLPGETRTVALSIRPGLADSPLRVIYEWPADAPPASRRRAEFAFTESSTPPLPRPIDHSAPLVVVFGPGGGFEQAIKSARWPRGGDPQVVGLASADLARLPDSDLAWEGVDRVVLTSANPDYYAALGDPQRQALLTWLERGGRICLALGAVPAELPTGKSLLGRLVPGDGFDTHVLAVSRGLEEYARSDVPLLKPGPDRLTVTVPIHPRGVVQASERGAVPLVIFTPHGLGEVRYCGVDLDGPLLKTWKAAPTLRLLLLGLQPADDTPGADAGGGNYLQDRITDLTTDLYVGLERFPGVRTVEPWLVGLLIGLYLLLIGPVDYVLVRRLLKRPEATWITFPLWVLVASIAAFLLADSAKGRRVLVNRAEVLDLDAASQTAASRTWYDIFSPSARTFDLRQRPKFTAGPAEISRLTWQGIPEPDALGGMGNVRKLAAGTGSANVPDSDGAAYRLAADGDGVTGVPILYHSTRAFVGRSFTRGPLPLEAVPTGKTLNRAPESLSVRNGFDADLRSLRLIVGQDAFEVGDLAAGERKTYRLGTLERRGVLDRLAKMRQVLDRESSVYRYQREPFRPGDGDLARTFEIMLFHELLDGRKYTRLHHSAGEADLSHLLRSGRLLLVGELSRPVTELLSGDAPLDADEQSRITLVRLSIPWTDAPAP